MELYTHQIGKWRQLQDRGIPLLDTTVKSGVVQLAPRWDMVLDHKKGLLSDAEYTQQYLRILDYWWFRDPLFFEELFRLPQLSLGCYCAPGKFCHRYLLVEFFRQVTAVDYRGELT